MKERTSDRPSLIWRTMDVSDKLDFGNELFDVVIDKGCLDCVLCAEYSTNAVFAALFNISRICQGTFIMISVWGPEKWQGVLETEVFGWNLYIVPIPGTKEEGSEFWMYVLEKKDTVSSSTSIPVTSSGVTT
jgi:hypothetical protein